MNATPQQFLDAIFDGPDGFIEVRVFSDCKTSSAAQPDEQQCWYPSVHDLMTNLPAINRHAGKNACGVFFGVLPRAKHGGSKSSDVLSSSVVWVDIDWKDFEDGEAGARRRLNDFPIAPNILVKSGNGFHAYWLLNEPQPPGLLSRMAKGISIAVGGDNTHDTARLLRLPGTLNLKDPAHPKAVEVIKFNPLRISVDDLEEWISEAPPPRQSIDWSEATSDPRNRLDQLLASDVTLRDLFENKGKPSINEHGDPIDTSNSGYDYSFVMRLVHLGVDNPHELDQYLTVRHGARGITKAAAYRKHTIETALSRPLTIVPREPQCTRPLLSDEARYGLAGKFLDIVEGETEADPAAMLVQFLIGFGNQVGSGPYFPIGASKHRMNLYCVIVGKTAKARKGTSWNECKRVLRMANPEWAQERVISGLSSGEGLIFQVRDKTEKTRMQDGDPVTEVTDVGISDKRLLVVEEEFSKVLKQGKRDGNTLSETLREAWDGNDLGTATRKEPLRATEPHISLIGHITEHELQQVMPDRAKANGLGNRFLWVCAKRAQLLPDGGKLHDDDPLLLDLRMGVQRAAEEARKFTKLTRDKESQKLWETIYKELADERPGLAGSMTARGEAMVLRLSCVYALLDSSSTIRAPHIRAAKAVWDYCDASVGYLMGDQSGNKVADKILRALREAGEQGMSRTDIRNLLHKNKSKAVIDEALRELKSSKAAYAKKETTEGRPAEKWFAT